MTRYQAVEVSADGPVGMLRLCRPDLHNRFDDTMFGELGPALGELEVNPDVRAVVLASTGRTFSASPARRWSARAAGSAGAITSGWRTTRCSSNRSGIPSSS